MSESKATSHGTDTKSLPKSICMGLSTRAVAAFLKVGIMVKAFEVYRTN